MWPQHNRPRIGISASEAFDATELQSWSDRRWMQACAASVFGLAECHSCAFVCELVRESSAVRGAGSCLTLPGVKRCSVERNGHSVAVQRRQSEMPRRCERFVLSSARF